MTHKNYTTYWQNLWLQFTKNTLGYIALWVVFGFILTAIYAPFLASSKPLFLVYEGNIYFPLFRYLFYSEFFTKNVDLFFNILIFTFPLGVALFLMGQKSLKSFCSVLAVQLLAFLWLLNFPISNPAANQALNLQRQAAKKDHPLPSWSLELNHMSPYAKLNMLLDYQQQKESDSFIKNTLKKHLKEDDPLLLSPPTLFSVNEKRSLQQKTRDNKALQALFDKGTQASEEVKTLKASLIFIADRNKWLQEESAKLHFKISPLLSSFHWEDDAGGSQLLNQHLNWWQMSRINQKSLLAGLIFGTRISLVVGILAVTIALSIAIPIGALAGFFGGTFDIIVSRILEVWESMPTFFMLLLIVAITQSKSIFLIILVIGFFGWTGFSRFLRGEFFKQRNLPYVEACHSLGYSNSYIIFIHILPNAIPPLLTLLPFSIMGAISGEAGLSFLGLGEEGSCSWGVLMDEGRSSFPAQSQLLWPPAFLLTLLLVSIALVGDALRDTLDPKLHS